MGASFIIIFVSLFVVIILILLAFFPIRVSWFYYREKHKPPRSYRSTPPKRGILGSSSKREYNRIDDEDNYDDPEL